ncbi:MAG: hypothetical protein WA624_23090 [Methylocella sp.]
MDTALSARDMVLLPRVRLRAKSIDVSEYGAGVLTWPFPQPASRVVGPDKPSPLMPDLFLIFLIASLSLRHGDPPD